MDIEEFLRGWPNPEAAAAVWLIVFEGETLWSLQGCGVGKDALQLCWQGLQEAVQ